MRFYYTVFPGSSVVKNPPTMQAAQEKSARRLGREGPLAQEMATHYSVPVWRIPWTEEPGGLHGVAKSWTRLSYWAHNEILHIFIFGNVFHIDGYYQILRAIHNYMILIKNIHHLGGIYIILLDSFFCIFLSACHYTVDYF